MQGQCSSTETSNKIQSGTITISAEEYADLIDSDTRLHIIVDLLKSSKYADIKALLTIAQAHPVVDSPVEKEYDADA